MNGAVNWNSRYAVLYMTSIEHSKCGIADRDVGRVADNDVILTWLEDAEVLVDVLGVVAELSPAFVLIEVEGLVEAASDTKKRVADGEAEPHRGNSDKRAFSGRLQAGNGEAESCDSYSEGVDVDAVNRRHRAAHPLLGVEPRRSFKPRLVEPLERTEQEVARTAGRVDQLESFESELRDRRGQRLVEDELLHKHRRLQKRVCIPGVFREVLVEVAEKSGLQVGVGEVVNQGAVVVRAPPESDQRRRGLRADLCRPHRVVLRVDQCRSSGLRSEHTESLLEPMTTIVMWGCPESMR